MPSDAELDILSAVWTLGPSTVREVHDALGTRTGYTTALKQMQLMATKGRLLLRNERLSHLYSAAQPKEETQARLAADLLRRASARPAIRIHSPR